MKTVSNGRADNNKVNRIAKGIASSGAFTFFQFAMQGCMICVLCCFLLAVLYKIKTVVYLFAVKMPKNSPYGLFFHSPYIFPISPKINAHSQNSRKTLASRLGATEPLTNRNHLVAIFFRHIL